MLKNSILTKVQNNLINKDYYNKNALPDFKPEQCCFSYCL